MKKFKFTKSLKGVVAFETIITTPVSLAMIFFSIMMLIFVIDFHLISNSASLICNQLNMGDTGYIDASSKGPSSYILKSNVYINEPDKVKTAFLSRNNGDHNVRVDNTKNKIFDRAANYYVEKLDSRGGLTMPYVDITSMKCQVFYNGLERIGFNTEKGKTESGDLIRVTINYEFAGFFPVRIVSYGFID